MAEYTRGLFCHDELGFSDNRAGSLQLLRSGQWVPSVAVTPTNGNKAERRMADVPKMGTRLSLPGGRRARRPGRQARPRTAFVLSGGGNQGVSQVGMLRALLERGIVPDVVVGTSAGALERRRRSRTRRTSRAWPNSRRYGSSCAASTCSRADGSTGPGTSCAAAPHLFGDEGLAALIHHSTPARSFADLEVPLRVIATDLDTGEEVVLARGPLKPALLASTALPGVFPIVHHDGRRLVDGGVVDNVPLSHALAGPIDRIFVLNVSAGMNDRVERSPLDVVMTSFTHARSQRFELELRHVPPDVELIVLPAPARPARPVRLLRGRELIDEAYELSNDALDEHAAELAERESQRRRVTHLFVPKPGP